MNDTPENNAQLRMEALRLFAMNTRMNALDALRADMRDNPKDDKSLLYYQNRMDERLSGIQGSEKLDDTSAEAERQRYRMGMDAIEAAEPKDLPAIIARQQRLLAERLQRDGLDLAALDRGGREALSDKAIQNLTVIEESLIQKEMAEGMRRNLQFQDPEYRDDIRQGIDSMLQRAQTQLAPFMPGQAERAMPEMERNPVTLLPPEFPPYADEPRQPDMESAPKKMFIPVPPGSQPFLPPVPRRGGPQMEELPPPPLEKPRVEELPPPPETMPEEKPDPASRNMEDLEKILGPRLRKGRGMNYQEKVPEIPPEGPVAGNFDKLKGMSDAALSTLASTLPGSSGEQPPMEAAPGAIPTKTGGRSLA